MVAIDSIDNSLCIDRIISRCTNTKILNNGEVEVQPTRIWCDFEVYSAVMNPNMELDIAASINIDGKGLDAKILTKFMVPGESAVAKSAREQDFPIFLLDQGLGVCLEKGAQCSKCFTPFLNMS